MYDFYLINVVDEDWQKYFSAKIRESYDTSLQLVSLSDLQALEVDTQQNMVALVWVKDCESFVDATPEYAEYVADKFDVVIYLEANRTNRIPHSPPGMMAQFDLPVPWQEVTSRIYSLIS